MQENKPPLYRLTLQAEDDLIEIYSYGAETWGEERAEAYIEELYTRFEWLSQNPLLGRARSEIKPGYRSWRQESHVIFYRIVGSCIEILGVLHGSMDIEKHL